MVKAVSPNLVGVAYTKKAAESQGHFYNDLG